MATDMDYIQAAVESASRESRESTFRDSVEPPSATEVTLPGGLYNPIDGVVIKTALVREINGWDEEVLARLAAKENPVQGEQLIALLERATISIGEEKATPEVLNLLYAGDWDALLLAIRIASYGADVAWKFPCQGCGMQSRIIALDLTKCVSPREIDIMTEDEFTYEGKRSTYVVGFPKGESTRRLLRNRNSTAATVVTETLYGSIRSIDGSPVSSIDQIKSMSSADREALFIEINSKMPSLRLEEVKSTCNECGSEVNVPLSLAALFRGRTSAV